MNFKLLVSSLALLGASSTATAQTPLKFYTIQVLEAEEASDNNGALRKTDTHLENISSGEWFSIMPHDLGDGVDTIVMRYAKGDESEINLEIRRRHHWRN